jgi:hypothetical protein
MKFVLRSIAIVAALSVFVTVWFMLRFGLRGWAALLRSGGLGVATVAGWVMTVSAGPIAAVQLFRLRLSGRIAALMLFGTMLAYYCGGIFLLRTPSKTWET